MEPKRLSETMTVSGQITVDDVATLAAQGVRVIVNNRPDGEEAGQPASAEIAAAAEAAGVTYVHAPITPSALTPEAVAAVRDAIAGADGPVHGFCRSGGRSTALWAMAEAGREADVDALLKAANGAGYDIGGIRPMLERVKAERG